MLFSLPSSPSNWGQAVLPCLLVSSTLINAIAIPAGHGGNQALEVAYQFARDTTEFAPVPEKRHEQNLPRVAPVPVKPPTTKPIKPLDPVDPVEPPPRLNPADPANPDTAPPVRLNPNDPVAPTGPDGKPLSTNPGPHPDLAGPVPSEADITALISVPENKAIFFSGTWEKVEPYRKQTGLYTDTQAYPPGYTAIWKDVDKVKRREFADRFSRVFAKDVKGEVHVMVNWEAGPNPAQVFHSQEWPILKEGLATGRITKLIQVNPNNYAETRIYDPTIYGLTKRTADAVDLNNVPWDVNLDALDAAVKMALKK